VLQVDLTNRKGEGVAEQACPLINHSILSGTAVGKCCYEQIRNPFPVTQLNFLDRNVAVLCMQGVNEH
jgi:hypothetical protein